MNNTLSALNPVSVSLVSSQLQPAGASVVQQKTAGEPEENPSSPDKVDISPQARRLSLSLGVSQADDTEQSSSDYEGRMSEQELRELQTLKRRDAEVRSHEQAHLAAAGQYARGGASFAFERGPDGASYAVGGQVGIDLSKERTPEDTVKKMQTVRRAALAPLSPSAADRSIAARAAVMESQARQELLLQNQEEILRGASEEVQPQGDVPVADTDSTAPALSPPGNTTVLQMIATYSHASQG
jgi:SprA-related family